jgi:hypothetical protein
LAENGAKLPKEDLDRYKLQLECVTELGKIFEDPQYNDKNEETKARVSTLVEKVSVIISDSFRCAQYGMLFIAARVWLATE